MNAAQRNHNANQQMQKLAGMTLRAGTVRGQRVDQDFVVNPGGGVVFVPGVIPADVKGKSAKVVLK